MLGFQVWVKQVPRQEGIPKRDTVSSSMYPFSHSQIKASKKTQKALQLCASSLLESQCEILIMDWLLHLPFFAARPMVFLRGFPFQICRDWAAIVHNLTLVSFVGFFVILYFCGLLMEDMLSSYFCNHLLLMSFFFLPKNAEFPWPSARNTIPYHNPTANSNLTLRRQKKLSSTWSSMKTRPLPFLSNYIPFLEGDCISKHHKLALWILI